MPDLFFSLPCAQIPSTKTGHEREPAFPFTFCSQLGFFCYIEPPHVSFRMGGWSVLPFENHACHERACFILVQNAGPFLSDIVSCP